ncbi:MAG: response regulator transcription factor, partial [Chloroflexi bacterium]|nr:response regulator transcription factor [Chloroflexota bacterium]
RRARRGAPRTKVIVLSMYDNEAYVAEALQAGADAYVLKRSTSQELVTAIREALEGRRYLSPPLSGSSIETYLKKATSMVLDLYEMLTVREREVLQLTAEGHSSTEIADRLSISSRTVENHRANFMRKLGLHSQTDIVRYALRRGILPLEG